MSRDWSNIQTPFQYHRGWIGKCRTWLPAFLGGIDRSHFDFATQVWTHVEERKIAQDQYTFQDFVDILTIEPNIKQGTPLYTTKHGFINALFDSAHFEVTELNPTTLANHWALFNAHLEKPIKQSIEQSNLKFRLQFSQAIYATDHFPGKYYSRYHLIGIKELKESFLEGQLTFSTDELDFIFDVHDIEHLLDDDHLSKLIEQDHPLVGHLIDRYSATIEQETEHFAVVSRLHYLKTDKLELSLLQRIIHFFKPKTTEATTEPNSPVSPLTAQNVLFNFVDRVIALGNKKPSKAELALFNDYRLRFAPDDPYYFLVAKSFKLVRAEEQSAFKFNWLTFDINDHYRSKELPPAVKENVLKTLKANIKSIILDKFSAEKYGLKAAGIATRSCDKFGQSFNKNVIRGAKADNIRHFTSALTMAPEDKAYYKLASLPHTHPFIEDLKILQDTAKQLESDPAISHYRSEEERKAHAFSYFKGQAMLKIADFKRRVSNGKNIYESEINKASKGHGGEIDYRIKGEITQAIISVGGEIIPDKKKHQAATNTRGMQLTA